MPTLEAGMVTAALRYLLDQVRNAAVAASVVLPERQYVTTGGAVYDCPQVTISGNAAAIGLAGDLSAVGGVPQVGPCPPGWNLVVEIAIVRGAAEMPRGARGTVAPSVADIEADTAQADADASVLVAAIEATAGGDQSQIGNVPMSIQFGEVAGTLTAVVATCTVNLWVVPEP